MVVLRKIAVVLFGVAWAAFAYLLWPEGIAEREVSSIPLVDLLKVASIAAVAAGIGISIWTWRG
jgi:hypothetical protein